MNTTNPVNPAKQVWRRLSTVPELSSILPMVILFIGVSCVNSYFVNPRNLGYIAKMMSIWGMMAIGECFIMMVGEIDISISSMCCWCGMFFAWLLVQLQLHWSIAILLTIGMSVLCSLANAVLIISARLPAFVVSIGMSFVYKGLARYITQSQPIKIKSVPWGKEFAEFGTSRIFGTGWSFPILMLVFIIFWYVLHRTTYGRKVTDTGDSLMAARISGVDTDRIKFSVFAISGLMVGLTACLMVGRETTANPANCAGWEMNCIAACAIGGASMSGGAGSIIGLFFGVVFMAGVLNAINLLSINSNWQNIIVGFSIMISVTMDVLRRQKKLGVSAR